MTNLLATTPQKEQMTDLRRSAGQTRRTTTANHDRIASEQPRRIRRVLTGILTALAVGRRTVAGVSHSTTAYRSAASNNAARDIR